ncbi:MAG: lamin tail domain-containing protein [Patescibacteria group bacterium]
MKNRGGIFFHFIFLLILFSTAGFFILPESVSASAEDLIVTEIMYDPKGNNSEHSDWIEIYNPTPEEIIIKAKDFGFIEKNKEKPTCHTIKEDFIVEPKEFSLLVSSDIKFKEDYKEREIHSKIIDSSFDITSGDTFIKFSNDRCETFFLTTNFYSQVGGKDNNKTLEKIKFNGNDLIENWQESFSNKGTPGEENSDESEKTKYENKIIINEIFPYPNSKIGEKEYVEIYNKSSEEIDISEWFITDSKNHEHYFSDNPEEEKIELSPGKYEYIEGNLDLNNDEDTVNLKDENGNIVDKVSYKNPKESISYNFNGTGWQWSSKLTKKSKNEFDNPVKVRIIKDDNIYKNVYANFEAKTDFENPKVVWDFGDGGSKSYLQKTRHKYLKTGIYQASLEVKGKSEDFEESFEVEVGKFKESKLKIVKVKANPKGKDDKETVTIKNNSKKKVNLKGWSIATGWENLYNHPITKKLIIKPGESKEITKKYSLFTLNNKQTKIELRRPDGSVEAKIKYSKKEGVQDDETYEKTENGWEWVGSSADAEAMADKQNNADETQTSADSAQTNAQNDLGEERIDNNGIKSEIQDDEPVENGESASAGATADEKVLGMEIAREDKTGNNVGFFQSMLWSTNQSINNFINYFF